MKRFACVFSLGTVLVCIAARAKAASYYPVPIEDATAVNLTPKNFPYTAMKPATTTRRFRRRSTAPRSMAREL
jgi:hypothetical protein